MARDFDSERERRYWQSIRQEEEANREYGNYMVGGGLGIVVTILGLGGAIWALTHNQVESVAATLLGGGFGWFIATLSSRRMGR